ncbi:hypothetical protein LRP67_01060 [Nocardioides sp. cx-169]|uniref:hypothetical protein n=1 Tax=Nocardioides sp. cx-169 TaxID=2899080 RepID=UPI001E51CDA7|nr:hypothetical protein [Nocardioides sp. cx-169]MCD4532678.1 hypothetical protein [Nocardioides sp. cx-169]
MLRAWGVSRTLLFAALLSAAVQLAAATYVGLPSFEAAISTLDLVPPAAGMLLAAPLVDQTPELTLRSTRPLALLLLLRYAAVQCAGAVVLASLALTAWTLERAGVVVLFLAGSAVAAAALGGWYWVPVLGAGYAWLWRAQDLRDLADADVPLLTAAAGLGLGGLFYVAAVGHRLRRVRCPRG